MTGTFRIVAISLAFVFAADMAFAQIPDKKDVRKGNRDFRKENYKEAEIDYRKGLVKDSTSVAANIDLANTLYRMDDHDQAGKYYDAVREAAAEGPHAGAYWFNVGDNAVKKQDWNTAVDAFKQSMIANPSDVDAKENYLYAKQMLEDQQNQQNNQNQNQQDNQNQQNDQNQDQQDNQNQQNDQNQNDKDREDQQNQNQDQNQQDNQDRDQQPSGQEPQISPQQAQQMLQAIQEKEKETQDKVNKEKAAAFKSREKEKNW